MHALDQWVSAEAEENMVRQYDKHLFTVIFERIPWLKIA